MKNKKRVSVARFGVVVVMFVIGALGLYKGFGQMWTEPSISWTLPLEGEVIVLDAGHGGVDPGAVSASGVLEKEVTLSVTMKLRDLLTQAGAHVILLRDDDSDLAKEQTKSLRKRKNEDLKARAQTVNASGASLLISLHCNSVPSDKWTGAQTFYNSNLPNSKELASNIQDALKDDLGMSRTVKKNDDIYLLKQAKIPSALVELGFLSNPDEAKLLQSDDHQQKLALSVYHGILTYYGEHQKS